MNDPRPVQPSTREAYYARAATWAVDQEKMRRRSSRLAWLVAGIAIGIAMLEAVALSLLTPLKTVVPYTVLVDRNTGHVQVLDGTRLDQITADEALTQSLLAQYVIAREGFDISTLNADYRKVSLWSGQPERGKYVTMMLASNPISPLERLPRSTVVSVRIKSISPIAPNTALVRFDLQRRDQGQNEATTEAFVSVIRYKFTKAAMSLEDRLTNPLGFQVMHYRRDQEALPEATQSAVERMSTPEMADLASSSFNVVTQ